MSHNLFNGPKELLDVIKDITEKKKLNKEDHMPNDEVLYKAAKDSGRKDPGESGDSGVSERCWDGYEPTPGVKAYAKGSCRKEEQDLEEEVIFEGKNVTLNKPFRTPDGPKKFAVYVKNDKGNVVKVTFGDPNMEIKRDNPERRASYRARHNCSDPGPKWKANYWSCKMWGEKPVSKITEDEENKSPLQVPTGDGNYYDKEKIRRMMGGDEELGETPKELTPNNVEDMKKDVKSDKVEESPECGDENQHNSKQLGSKEVKENYASQEPSSAVGQRREEELPKNVDVVIDSSMYGTGYRVLISFPNMKPLLFPEAGKESARSKQELVASIPVQYLSHCIDKIDFAFKNSKEHNSNFQSSDAGVDNYTPNVVKGEKS
jgi:hypothetical protein